MTLTPEERLDLALILIEIVEEDTDLPDTVSWRLGVAHDHLKYVSDELKQFK